MSSKIVETNGFVVNYQQSIAGQAAQDAREQEVINNLRAVAKRAKGAADVDANQHIANKDELAKAKDAKPAPGHAGLAQEGLPITDAALVDVNQAFATDIHGPEELRGRSIATEGQVDTPQGDKPELSPALFLRSQLMLKSLAGKIAGPDVSDAHLDQAQAALEAMTLVGPGLEHDELTDAQKKLLKNAAAEVSTLLESDGFTKATGMSAHEIDAKLSNGEVVLPNSAFSATEQMFTNMLGNANIDPEQLVNMLLFESYQTGQDRLKEKIGEMRGKLETKKKLREQKKYMVNTLRTWRNKLREQYDAAVASGKKMPPFEEVEKRAQVVVPMVKLTPNPYAAGVDDGEGAPTFPQVDENSFDFTEVLNVMNHQAERAAAGAAEGADGPDDEMGLILKDLKIKLPSKTVQDLAKKYGISTDDILMAWATFQKLSTNKGMVDGNDAIGLINKFKQWLEKTPDATGGADGTSKSPKEQALDYLKAKGITLPADIDIEAVAKKYNITPQQAAQLYEKYNLYKGSEVTFAPPVFGSSGTTYEFSQCFTFDQWLSGNVPDTLSFGAFPASELIKKFDPPCLKPGVDNKAALDKAQLPPFDTSSPSPKIQVANYLKAMGITLPAGVDLDAVAKKYNITIQEAARLYVKYNEFAKEMVVGDPVFASFENTFSFDSWLSGESNAKITMTPAGGQPVDLLGKPASEILKERFKSPQLKAGADNKAALEQANLPPFATPQSASELEKSIAGGMGLKPNDPEGNKAKVDDFISKIENNVKAANDNQYLALVQAHKQRLQDLTTDWNTISSTPSASSVGVNLLNEMMNLPTDRWDISHPFDGPNDNKILSLLAQGKTPDGKTIPGLTQPFNIADFNLKFMEFVKSVFKLAHTKVENKEKNSAAREEYEKKLKAYTSLFSGFSKETKALIKIYEKRIFAKLGSLSKTVADKGWWGKDHYEMGADGSENENGRQYTFVNRAGTRNDITGNHAEVGGSDDADLAIVMLNRGDPSDSNNNWYVDFQAYKYLGKAFDKLERDGVGTSLNADADGGLNDSHYEDLRTPSYESVINDALDSIQKSTGPDIPADLASKLKNPSLLDGCKTMADVRKKIEEELKKEREKVIDPDSPEAKAPSSHVASAWRGSQEAQRQAEEEERQRQSDSERDRRLMQDKDKAHVGVPYHVSAGKRHPYDMDVQYAKMNPGDFEEQIKQVDSDMDSLNEANELDMMQIQSLNNQIQQILTALSNLEKQNSQTKSSIVANLK